jgi:hypothetical protein
MRRHAATVLRNVLRARTHRPRHSHVKRHARSTESVAAMLMAKSRASKNAGKTAVFLSGIGDLRKK